MKTALSDGHNIAMATLADEVLKTILAEPHFNKDVLLPKVTAILKAYIRKTNFPTHANKKFDNTKQMKTAISISKGVFENKYWKDEMRKIVSSETMQKHFDDLAIQLKENGFE